MQSGNRLCKAFVYEEVGSMVRLQGTDIGRLQNCPQRSFDSHRVLPDKLPVSDHYAAEVLGPRTVQRRVDYYAADLLRPEFLRFRVGLSTLFSPLL